MSDRIPTLQELLFFIQNPYVGGMMGISDSYPTGVNWAQRGYQSVVMPPDTRLGRDSVKKNETLRLLLQYYMPKSELSEEQKSRFSKSQYSSDGLNAVRSILARIGANDPSANRTFEQDSEYRSLSSLGGLLGGYGDGY